jgi:hypothetical protein
MWTILNGAFSAKPWSDLPRAKSITDFTAQESRRIWQAFRQGVWRINECVDQWRNYVLTEEEWVKATAMKAIGRWR